MDLTKSLFSAVVALSLLGSASTARAAAASSALPSNDKAVITNILNNMTLEEKIGQMMFIGIRETKLDAYHTELIKELKAGGIILFGRNMNTPYQVKRLNKALQAVGTLKVKGSANGVELPLFITVDEEGGEVSRMVETWPDGPIPSQQSIAAAGKPELARKWAVKTAKALKKMGFNINFAPVADVGMRRERSYSKDAKIVSTFLKAAMQGYQQEGVISTLKHFPGMGRAIIDPHYDGSVIRTELAELERTDFLPFAEAVQGHSHDDFMVMVGHLSYAALDPKLPASISPNTITGQLRGKYGFDGLVITDDLEMHALLKYYDINDLGVQTVLAGSDFAFICHTPDYQKGIYQGLLQAAKNGRLSQEVIDDRVGRIIRVKLKHLAK